MKSFKKIISIICLLLCLTACSFRKTAKDTVVDYLNEYRNLSVNVLNALNKIVDNEIELTDNQKIIYKDILKKQYKDLNYTLTNELYDGNYAVFTVKVEVYDLYKAKKNASLKLINNPEYFYDENNTYQVSKYLDYKLNLMKNSNDRIDYSIDVEVKKIDDNWIVQELTLSNLEKIHGIYNYEENLSSS